MDKVGFCPVGVIALGKAIVNHKKRNVDNFADKFPVTDNNEAPRHINDKLKDKIANLWDGGHQEKALEAARKADDFHFELGAQYLDEKVNLNKVDSGNYWLD